MSDRTYAISTIYVLIRSKKNLNPKDRLDKILKDPVFNGLHKEQPDFVNKIVAVEGNVGQLNIGLSDEDWNTISEEVDVIYYAAANVKFDMGLSEAVLTNVRGTREALRLGRACRKLRAYVHVSTAYSHATRSREGTTVYERFHESPAPPETVIQLAESKDHAKLEDLAQCWKRDWPNTYTLSKALADEVIRTMAGNLPVCIVKPSIVVSTYCEPTPGWVDTSCVFGPSGMMIGIGLGLMHTMLMDKDKLSDLVPADMVTNAIIAAAWEIARARPTTEPKIFTVSNTRNAVYWRQYTNEFLKLYQKVYKSNEAFSYFMLKEWFFDDENTHKLYMDMSETDRAIFNFDVETLNVKELLVIWMIGLRRYIVKDNLEGTAYAKRKMFWLQMLNYVAIVFYAFLWWKLFQLLFWSITLTLFYLRPIFIYDSVVKGFSA